MAFKTTVRVGFDISTDLKQQIDTNVPYGTLSTLMRTLLIAFFHTLEQEGLKNTLSAVLNNRIKIVIIKNFDKERVDTNET